MKRLRLYALSTIFNTLKKCAEQKKKNGQTVKKNGCRAAPIIPSAAYNALQAGYFCCILRISEEGFFGIEAIP